MVRSHGGDCNKALHACVRVGQRGPAHTDAYTCIACRTGTEASTSACTCMHVTCSLLRQHPSHFPSGESVKDVMIAQKCPSMVAGDCATCGSNPSMLAQLVGPASTSPKRSANMAYAPSCVNAHALTFLGVFLQAPKTDSCVCSPCTPVGLTPIEGIHMGTFQMGRSPPSSWRRCAQQVFGIMVRA